MFPDASFDVSTNKSTTNSSRRRIPSPHMPPHPLQPNNPSMYSRSLPPALPTTVHRNDQWDHSHVPPSPLQIVRSRQSASTSDLREGREPHSDGYYLNQKCRRGCDREEREPPSQTTNDYHDSFDKQCEIGYNARAYERRHDPVREHELRNHSIETHQRCNCENRRFKQVEDARYYGKNEYPCKAHHHQHHQVTHQIHQQNLGGHFHQCQRERSDPRSSHERHTESREYANLPKYNSGSSERVNPDGYVNESQMSLPESPLSLLSFDERRWSPKSDDATLHADTFQVPKFVASTGSNERRNYEKPQDQDNLQYGNILLRDYPQQHYHHEQSKQEFADYEYNHDGRPTHQLYHHNVNIPTHVSYQSRESRTEHRFGNASPDRRDDYSGSTIPTYSTVTPRRASRSSHEYRPPAQESGLNLRIDIPNSPNVPINAHQLGYLNNDRYCQYHQPPSTVQSSSHRSAPISASHNHPPYSTRSEPADYSHSTQTRVMNAQREQERSEARHQILKEIHQATEMRNSALDDNDRRFWDMQIATLNKSFRNL